MLAILRRAVRGVFFIMVGFQLGGCLGSNPPVSNPPPVAPPSVPPQQGEIRNVSSAELKALLEQGVPLVDIRRPDEWSETGVIAGSQRLTLFNEAGGVMPGFFQQITRIAPRSESVAIICQAGSRSRVAAQMLARSGGYPVVYNAHKGIDGWLSENRPVNRGD